VGKITYAIVAPEEAIFSLFSLPMPRFAHPGTFRRASKPMREVEPESTLAFFPGTREDSSVTTLFGFTGRWCSTCGIGADVTEGAETADVWVAGISGRTLKGNKDIFAAR